MSSRDDLVEAPQPIVVEDIQEDRRRPGRLKSIAPNLLPLLRDPASVKAPDTGSTITGSTITGSTITGSTITGSTIVARALALMVVCLCLALGYAMRGVP